MNPRPRESDEAVHQPVLLRETVRLLDLAPGMTVVDGTVGAAGHARRISENIGAEGTLIGLDRDSLMLAHAARFVNGPNRYLRQASYAELPAILAELGIDGVDRILLDLGLASDQLADESRGFSYESSGPLDLRFDVSRGKPAWRILEEADERELADMFREYGEEPFAGPIAREIASRRGTSPVRTAAELAEAVAAALPGRVRGESRKNPATRVFQALRIASNDELGQLRLALDHALPDALRAGGRAVVISFHSLEDRLVKNAFRDKERWHNLTPKPIVASTAERKLNPRSRSAKARAATKR